MRRIVTAHTGGFAAPASLLAPQLIRSATSTDSSLDSSANRSHLGALQNANILRFIFSGFFAFLAFFAVN